MKKKMYLDDYDWDDISITDTFNINEKMKNELRKEKRKKRIRKKKSHEETASDNKKE